MRKKTVLNSPGVLSIVVVEAPQIRLRFDGVLSAEINNVCAAVDLAIQETQRADALLPGPEDAQRAQQAHCLALTRKSLNDIIGSLEILRTGYFDLSQGILRGVIEGFCTAILIHKDSDIFQQYLRMQYPVNKSVASVVRRKDLGLNAKAAAGLKANYEHLHKLTHPTILAVASQFPLEEAGFPLGGHYDPPKMEHYRDHLKRLQTMALNIAGFLQQSYRPSPTNSATNPSPKKG